MLLRIGSGGVHQVHGNGAAVFPFILIRLHPRTAQLGSTSNQTFAFGAYSVDKAPVAGLKIGIRV